MLKTIMKHHNQEPAHAESEYDTRNLKRTPVQNIPLRLEHIGAIVPVGYETQAQAKAAKGVQQRINAICLRHRMKSMMIGGEEEQDIMDPLSMIRFRNDYKGHI